MFKKVRSFEAACKARGYDAAKALPNVKGMPKHLQDHMTNHAMAVIIAEAINDGKEPDWKNGEFDKWTIFWDMSGSAPSLYVVDDYCRVSRVGSRLCFCCREAAEWAAKTKGIKDIFAKAML